MNENIEKFKEKYQYANITDKEWQKIYKQASKRKKNFEEAVNNLVFKYLKANTNIKIILDYLFLNLKLCENENLTIGKRKLNAFFSFLESLDYILTNLDIETLLQRKEITNILKNIFNNRQIKESEIIDITQNCLNSELLYRAYLKEEQVHIIEDVPKSNSLLSYNEQIELIKKAKENNEEAITKLIFCNKGLVNKIAGKYSYRCNECFSYDDLESFGNMGLLKAIEKFDINKGVAFSTYAVHWIRQNITRELDGLDSTIHIPYYITRIKTQIDNYRSYVYNTEKREVDDQELIEVLNITPENLNRYNNLPVYTSLNATVSKDEDSQELNEYISDENISVENEVLDKMSKEELMRAIEKLPTKREQEILKLRFGFINEEVYTLERIAQIYNITHARVRQIEVKSLKALKEILISQNSNISINNKSKQIFDSHSIHQDLSKKMYLKFVSLLPNNERNIYCALRGIKDDIIHIKNTDSLNEKERKFLLLVDKQILEMFKYYLAYSKNNPKETEENILNEVKNHMIKNYITFRFSDISQRKLLELVNQLSEENKREIFAKNGPNLMELKEIEVTNEPIRKLEKLYKEKY